MSVHIEGLTWRNKAIGRWNGPFIQHPLPRATAQVHKSKVLISSNSCYLPFRGGYRGCRNESPFSAKPELGGAPLALGWWVGQDNSFACFAIRTYIVSFICALLTSSYFTVRRKVVCCPLSHEISLNLKFDNLKYLHVSTLQVLLVRLILLIRFCSNKCRCDVFLKVACVAEAILIKSPLRFSLCIQ